MATIQAETNAIPVKAKVSPMKNVVIGVLTCISIAFMVSTIVLVTKTPDAASTSSTPSSTKPPAGTNPCEGTKPTSGYPNLDCFDKSIKEQAGATVTKGYQGDFNSTAVPITGPFFEAGLCPVNVHFHLGAEHLSAGEFDEDGTGPTAIGSGEHRRNSRSEDAVREGFQCKLYDNHDEKFTKAFDWKHCKGMEVGQTYEIHWPHSKGGACGTPNQYQTPFYDGVFCKAAKLAPSTWEAIGVQSQVFVIVNDESYYYPDLMRGMIQDDAYGADLAMYTGSTTGTTRNNKICSSYAPITWHVDRKCQLISASAFDKMCADMSAQRDDMSDDLHAHGARELVDNAFAANNQVDGPQ